jgi:hypothetical protein
MQLESCIKLLFMTVDIIMCKCIANDWHVKQLRRNVYNESKGEWCYLQVYTIDWSILMMICFEMLILWAWHCVTILCESEDVIEHVQSL